MNLSFSLRRSATFSFIFVVALVLAACANGNGDPGTEPGDDAPAGGTIAVTDGVAEISADNLAFDASTIQAPAGEAFTVVLTNNESQPHNWSIYTEEGGDPIAQGDVIGEGETDEVEVPALEPGEYFFVCDVHAAEMTGTVVVEG